MPLSREPNSLAPTLDSGTVVQPQAYAKGHRPLTSIFFKIAFNQPFFVVYTLSSFILSPSHGCGDHGCNTLNIHEHLSL